MYIYVYICIYMYIYVYICIYMYIYICMQRSGAHAVWLCVYVCMCVCVCVCVCIHIYTYVCKGLAPTQLPETVALFHSLVGAAAVTTSIGTNSEKSLSLNKKGILQKNLMKSLPPTRSSVLLLSPHPLAQILKSYCQRGCTIYLSIYVYICLCIYISIYLYIYAQILKSQCQS